MRHVLLAGCGNIGFRHLQALCSLDDPTAVSVVEPATGAHARILDQFSAAADSGHRFQLTTELPASATSFDLVVIATAAAQRRTVVEAVLDRHDVSTMILEKILFQTVTDLHEVRAALQASDVAAFVNCGRRTFDGYRELRDRLEGPVDVAVRGNSFGLASNAIHFLDLAEFMNAAALTGLDCAGLDQGAIAGKRAGVVEVFGEVTARLDNGSSLSVESLDREPVRIEVTLRTAETSVLIDEVARTQSEHGNTVGFRSQNVSETTEIYADALATGRCDLTPYDDSVRQHQHFITGLRTHLGLSNDSDEPCPVS